ncbi:MAG: hypothetical protein KJ666_00865 [Bacteroidetes bacterium]|nr:hypothetical protein [Bacteroidota bacterium]MBU2586324.1 hypothetical protein [Bacteroidota bacterium]
MANKKITFLIIISLLFITNYSSAQETSSIVRTNIYEMKSKYHSFGSFFVITAEGGGNLAISDFATPGVSYLGRGGFELFFPSTGFATLGLRVFGGYGELTGKDDKGKFAGAGTSARLITKFKTQFSSIEGGLVIAFGKNTVIPYLAGGIYYIFKYSPADESKNALYSPVDRDGFLSYMGEFGIRFFLTNSISFNIAAKYNVGKVDDLDGFLYNKNDSYISAVAGLSLHLFHDRRVR